MVLLLDNYDSFTYNLAHRLGELGAEVRVVRNDAMTLDEIDALAPAKVVISPGPGRPESAGVSVAATGSRIPGCAATTRMGTSATTAHMATTAAASQRSVRDSNRT